MSNLLEFVFCKKPMNLHGMVGWLADAGRSWMELEGFDQKPTPCCYVVKIIGDISLLSLEPRWRQPGRNYINSVPCLDIARAHCSVSVI